MICTRSYVDNGQAAIIVPLEPVAMAPDFLLDLFSRSLLIVGRENIFSVCTEHARPSGGDDILLAVAVDVPDAFSKDLFVEFWCLEFDLGRQLNT